MELELIKYLNENITSTHRIAFYIAMIGIGGQIFVFKILSLFKTKKKMDKIISECMGYFITFSLSLYLFFMHMKIETFFYHLGISIVIHILWARLIDPMLLKKAMEK